MKIKPEGNPAKKADKKYPPDDPDEPIDAEEEQEERERKGRMKNQPKPNAKG